jgi:uncharacterized FlgJ-related protein
MRYTPKQIEKYQRQKYITLLEKVTKNLFKMFRDEKTTQEQFLKKFRELNKNTSDVYELVNELKMYSEKREIYSKELASIIKYNKFIRYDKN